MAEENKEIFKKTYMLLIILFEVRPF